MGRRVGRRVEKRGEEGGKEGREEGIGRRDIGWSGIGQRMIGWKEREEGGKEGRREEGKKGREGGKRGREGREGGKRGREGGREGGSYQLSIYCTSWFTWSAQREGEEGRLEKERRGEEFVYTTIQVGSRGRPRGTPG